MKIYATSDTHFGHDNLVHMGRGRPEDFGARLLKSISQSSGDLLIHCGDFCIGGDEKHVTAFMEAAKGFRRKVLVRGNHDKKSYSWYLSHGFDHVCEVMLATYFGKQLLFSHMPILRNDDAWSAYFAPDRNIHGHLHGNANRHAAKEIYDPAYHYDLAPDLHDYKIVSVETLLTTPS